MVRSRSRPSRVHRNSSLDVTLMMVCDEEELSPAQKAKQKRVMQTYSDFLKQIEEYKAMNAIIEYVKTPYTPAEIKALESKPVLTVEEHVTGTVIPVSIPVLAGPKQVMLTPVTARKSAVITPRPALSPLIVSSTSPANANCGSNKKNKGSTETPSPKPSSRPQRRAARAAIGLINETMDVTEQQEEDDDVIIVNESMARNLSSDGRARNKGRGKTMAPTSPVLGNPQNMLTIQQFSVARQQLQPPVSQPVLNKVTELYDVAPVAFKRVAPPQEQSVQPKRKQKRTEEEQGSWVPLDEYYYGKKEGDPAYREEKGEYRFKCWYCHKMLYNNLRIMMHMQGHIDSEKQQNLDLADLTQCKHCYKQFDTPFEMQNHVEKVHHAKSNVLVCRICEKDHDNQAFLRQHMKVSHNACEMPYICQLCNFRSSVYTDVVDHFKKRHDSSQCVMCFYCLKIFKVAFSKASGWGLTQNYYQHLQKHQSKINNKKCQCCKLTFINKLDVKIHRQRDHLPNFRGAISGTGSRGDTDSGIELVMIKLPTDNKSPKVKSLNAPVASKVQEIRALKFTGVEGRHRCRECGQHMLGPDHFKRYVECSLCRYATLCNNAYSAHMMNFHSGKSSHRRRSVPREKLLGKSWYCPCGYQSKSGNRVANHLVICSKRTAYLTRPEQKFFEYDDEQEEFNPFEPYEDEPCTSGKTSPEIPSLFGALGLVRKQESPAFSKKETSPSADGSAENESVLPEKLEQHKKHKKNSKALKQPENVPSSKSLGHTTESPTDAIPPELTGAQKWSTVRISEDNAPTKASVFLGSEKPKVSEEDKTKPGSEAMAIEDKDNQPDPDSKVEVNSAAKDVVMETTDDNVKDKDDNSETDGSQAKEFAKTEAKNFNGEKVAREDAPVVKETVNVEATKGEKSEGETGLDRESDTGDELGAAKKGAPTDGMSPGREGLEQPTTQAEVGGGPELESENRGVTSGNVAEADQSSREKLQQSTEKDELMLLHEGDVREEVDEKGGEGEIGGAAESEKEADREVNRVRTTDIESMEEIAEGMVKKGDDVEETGQVMDETGDAIEETGQVKQDTGDDIEETGQVMKETGDDMKETGQVMEETDQAMEEIGQSKKDTGKVVEETCEVMEDIDRDMVETGGQMEKTGDVIEARAGDEDTEMADGGEKAVEAVEDAIGAVRDGENMGGDGGVAEERMCKGDLEEKAEVETEDIEGQDKQGGTDTTETEENVESAEKGEKNEEKETTTKEVAENEGADRETVAETKDSVEKKVEKSDDVAQNEENLVTKEDGEKTEILTSEASAGEGGRHNEILTSEASAGEGDKQKEILTSEASAGQGDKQKEILTSEALTGQGDKQKEILTSEALTGQGDKQKEILTSEASAGQGDKQKEILTSEALTGQGDKQKEILTSEASASEKGDRHSTKQVGSKASVKDGAAHNSGSYRGRDQSSPDRRRSSESTFRNPDRTHGHQGRQGMHSDSPRSHDQRDRSYNQRRDDYRWQDQRQGNYRDDHRDRSHDRYHDNRQDYRDNRQGGYNQNRDRYSGGHNNQRGRGGGGGGQRGGYHGNDNYRGRGRGGGYQGRGGYGGYHSYN